jgi:hypothetical protein
MATRYPKSSHTGDKAVHFIKGICIDSEQAIFRAILETDLGIDGDIHLLNENGEPTGAFAHIQSKGGLSRVTKSGRYKIQTDNSYHNDKAFRQKAEADPMTILHSPTFLGTRVSCIV